jgi:hypothetical protein
MSRHLVEDECSITIDDNLGHAKAFDFVNIPQGTVHCFSNNGTATARMIVTFIQSGMEGSSKRHSSLRPIAQLRCRSTTPPSQQVGCGRSEGYGLEFMSVPHATDT